MSEAQEFAEKVRASLDVLGAWRKAHWMKGAHEALAELVRLAEEADTLREELRIREQSQIPVIPRVAGARLVSLEAELKRKEERDAWLIRQLDGCIEDADAVTAACGLDYLAGEFQGTPFLTARALASNLRDARAALGEPASLTLSTAATQAAEIAASALAELGGEE